MPILPMDEWAVPGPEYPIMSKSNVPMPTLYNADGMKLKPKLGIVELVLYNIAAMLAGVAAGYDVRLSNVSPLHPNLQPNRSDLSGSELTAWRPTPSSSDGGAEYDYTSSSGATYSHNTYHGPARHHRPQLNAQLVNLRIDDDRNNHLQQKPLRFTDSPQHYGGVGGGHVVGGKGHVNSIQQNAPNPSPRRKSSSTSNDGSDLYTPCERGATIYIPGDYHDNSHTNIGYVGYTQDTATTASDYSGTTMYGYGTDYAYDNPSSVSSSHTSATSRTNIIHTSTPQRQHVTHVTVTAPPAASIVNMCHRRTSSNVSNSSSIGDKTEWKPTTNNTTTTTYQVTANSCVNPNFRLDDEVQHCDYGATYVPVSYGRQGSGGSRQNSLDYGNERPTVLDVVYPGAGGTKLRSSMKRNNYQQQQQQSGGNTPTNPTPPDSLTSDDSSYVSAKDSANSSVSRVRFSPTLIDLDEPPQPMIESAAQARRSRQRLSLAEMEREFKS